MATSDETIQKRESAYGAVLDELEDIIYVADPTNHELLYVNRSAERIWGENLLGKRCYAVLQNRDAPCPFCTNHLIFGENEGKAHVWEFQNEVTKRWFRCVDKAIRWTDGRMVRMELAGDFTQRKEIEAELRRHQDHLQELVEERTAELARKARSLEHKERINAAVNRVFLEAIRCDTAEDLAKATLAIAEGLTGAAFGFIGELNASKRLDTIGISNPGWKACAMPDGVSTRVINDMALRGIWATVIETRQTQIIASPSEHPASVGVPEGHPPLTGFLGSPLMRDGVAVGLIALANKDGAFTAEDGEALEAVCGAFQEALLRLRLELRLRRQARLESLQLSLAERLQGDLDTDALCRVVADFLCEILDLPVALVHLPGEDGRFRPRGAHAHRIDEKHPGFDEGDGLVGQVLRDGKTLVLDELDETDLRIEAGLVNARPRCVVIHPVRRHGETLAVAELGGLRPPDEETRTLLATVNDQLAVAIESATARDLRRRLLEETQLQAEELKTRQEELNAANEELEEHNRRLRDSEERLSAQQEELRVSNEELAEKSRLLEQKNRDVEKGKAEVERSAKELARASRYKSEFLANMSHELRTPLNSLLLLARSLGDNKKGNLTTEQVESARVIHQSGSSLLSLINEILDLSKIEAGRMDLHLEPLRLTEVTKRLDASFRPLAEGKGLELRLLLDPSCPKSVRTDEKRLEQILRNLLGNAIKFTEQGAVELFVNPVEGPRDLRREHLRGTPTLSFVVRDTGIGIAPEHSQMIFEAFRQADGSTARRFGGTGLGLSITRELVHLLGGEIHLRSDPGKGSTFTIHLPLDGPPKNDEAPHREEGETNAAPGTATVLRSVPSTMDAREAPLGAPPLPDPSDDRERLAEGDRAILIIEDDRAFAGCLRDHCRDAGFKVLLAPSGESGLELVRRHAVEGIILDLRLPGMDGWQVLEALKGNPDTRHVPVHLMSVDDPTIRAMLKGAVGYVQKPVSPEQINAALSKIRQAGREGKRILLVEDDDATRLAIIRLVAEGDVQVDEARSGAEALERLATERYDCMILDLGLGDMDGRDLLRQIASSTGLETPPVIVYTGRELSWDENASLLDYSDSIIIKDACSEDRLLDEVALFLHRVVADLPERKRQVITNLHDSDALLRGKRVLVVDDDMRTLFALSQILGDRGMEVLKAENGQVALERLDADPAVDAVLMDVMMPVLDGLETMRRIRAQKRFAKLPVIALTAKAMKGDREQCIAAGASDYLTKPVDQDRLASLLRVWLYR